MTAAPVGAKARGVFINPQYKDLRKNAALFLPQRVAVIGQGASASTYSNLKTQYFSSGAVGAEYGYGSPVHLASRILLPNNGDGLGNIPMIIYGLNDAGGSAASVGDITPVNAATETQSYQVVVNNIYSEAFSVANGDSVASIVAAMVTAINANLNMPVIATDNTTDVVVTAKWKGASGNDLDVSVAGPSVGVTFGITQPVSGTVNPDVDDALNQFADDWETLVVNCLEIGDTTSLGKYQVAGDGRWASGVKKPFMVFTGNTIVDVTAATTTAEARPTDRINSQITVPGSLDLPLSVAADAAMRVAVLANNNPPHDYARQKLKTLVGGAGTDQWTYAQRDFAVKRGSSTSLVVDGVVNLDDVYTFYHPANEPIPAYAKVVNNVKIMNILYNVNLIFEADEWAGAPLIPDGQDTTNTTAKQPGDAVAALSQLIDSLALNALISEPATAKTTIVAVISDVDPNRLDISFTVQLTGNIGVVSIDYNFGYYFGSPVLV